MTAALIFSLITPGFSASAGTTGPVAGATDPGVKEQARDHMEAGEDLAGEDKLKEAADEYLKALELWDGFTDGERLRMAIHISWAERYDEAVEILNGTLSRNPGHIESRVHLAKTLLWANRLDDALAEAEKVLEAEPDNRDARLVKANAINWRGQPRRARTIYEDLLEEEEDFDVRLGLTHSLRVMGRTKAALRSSELLLPRYRYQERALMRLHERLRKTTRPTLDIRYRYYWDSDQNNVSAYSGLLTYRIEDVKLTASYMRTHAIDPTRSNFTDEAMATIYTYVTDGLGVGAGVGYAQTGDAVRENFLLWSAKANQRVGRGTVGVSGRREIMNATARIIENSIAFTAVNVYVSQNLTDRVFANAGYTFRDFNDGNTSHNARLNLRYLVRPKNPRINIGYRFRFLDFTTHPGNGYFDPDNFFSNRVYFSLRYENKYIKFFIEPYFGVQNYERGGDSNSELIAGGYSSLVVKFSRFLWAEFTAEGGNLALESAAGFEYYILGAGIKFIF